MEQTQKRMSLSAVTRGPIQAPQRTVLYGEPGCGKSTWASGAPDPIFLPLEDGTNALHVARFPRIFTWGDLVDALDEIRDGDHSFRTVVLDTLDALEPIVWKQTCLTKTDSDGKKATSVEDYGFGKGYVFALDLWRDVLKRLDDLRDSRGMEIILVAHSALVTVKSPDTEDFQRHDLKLHQRASAVVREWADHVLFATTSIGLSKLEKGAHARHKVTSLGERVVHTTKGPGWVAKTRSAAPDELPLSYDAWSEALAAHDDPSAIEASIESMLSSIPEEKHAAIRAAVTKARASSNAGAALRVVANRVALTAQKEAA